MNRMICRIVYDFDTPVDRRRPDAVKWAVGEGELPMWIADMDFPAAPEIREALKKRIDHGVFGYGDIPDEWYEAYTGWWQTRHGLTLRKDWLIFSTGVVPILSSVVRKLTTPNENVVLLTPVYNIFFNSIVNNGARALPCRLKRESGGYAIDFEDLENKLADPQTSLLFLCNPHNPIGKIWDRETLARIGDLAAKHRVVVVSDEIHCDITRPGTGYIPFASVSDACRDNSISCLSPTKAFNLAGIQTACACVPEPHLRAKVRRALNTDEVAEPNSFAVPAAVAAFTKGGRWLDEMRAYVFENRAAADEFFRAELPCVRPVPGDATYLLWLDVSDVSADSRAFCAFLREKTGLILTPGAEYGEGGEGFLRMNAACGKAVFADGLRRLKEGVEAYLKN